VMAEPCIVRTVVYTIIEDWHCAVLAPTPMEVHFETGEGYIQNIVNEVKGGATRPWDELSHQLFWRGARHYPHACIHLLRTNNPRDDIVELAERTWWINASYSGLPRSVFLDYRYLLDVGGSACVTCALLPTLHGPTCIIAQGSRTSVLQNTADSALSSRPGGMLCDGSLLAGGWSSACTCPLGTGSINFLSRGSTTSRSPPTCPTWRNGGGGRSRTPRRRSVLPLPVRTWVRTNHLGRQARILPLHWKWPEFRC
jgi:hypothetical protein